MMHGSTNIKKWQIEARDVLARIKILFPQQEQAMKYVTTQSVTCRGCGDIEMVLSVDATIFEGSQDTSVTHQSLGRMTGEPEQDHGAGCQPEWTDRHGPRTDHGKVFLPRI
jgi:hypothetical protein